MSSHAAPASRYARALLTALIAGGVRDAIICPGSRSQALAFAAAEAERAGAVRLHIRIDERSAGFLAIGIARESGMPAPVIVTSGSAVGNLLPAVLEAHAARVPMLLLTADRPAEMRGTRANQTTRQAGLFAEFARLSLDIDVDEALHAAQADVTAPAAHEPSTVAARALACSLGSYGADPAGAVHLNLQFREPLASFSEPFVGAETQLAQIQPDRPLLVAFGRGYHTHLPARETPLQSQAPSQLTVRPEHVYTHKDALRTVVIAGAGAGEEAVAFALAAGLPLLAEVVSGSRYGSHAITHYAELLADETLGGRVQRAIVFGHPTLTRQVPALLARSDVEVIVIDPHQGAQIEHYDPAAHSRVVIHADVDREYSAEYMKQWLQAWRAADQQLAERASEAAEAAGGLRLAIDREQLVQSVWAACSGTDRLVLAASRLVRVLDRSAEPRRIAVHANRGLAGIDGTVATAYGIALAAEDSRSEFLRDKESYADAGITRLLIGDLALLHDAGSLLLPVAREEVLPRIQIIVGNDGGGTIFDTLEAAQRAPSEVFERVMYTPQSLGLAKLAAAYGWSYAKVVNRTQLDAALRAPLPIPHILEVPLAR